MWYLRLNLLLEAAEDEWSIEFLKCRLDKHLAFMQSPHCNDQSALDYNREQANKILDMLFALLLGNTETTDKQSLTVAEKARQAWMNAYGDPTKPEVAEKIDAVVEQLKMQRLLARQADKKARKA
jgi:hypothetical protein